MPIVDEITGNIDSEKVGGRKEELRNFSGFYYLACKVCCTVILCCAECAGKRGIERFGGWSRRRSDGGASPVFRISLLQLSLEISSLDIENLKVSHLGRI